MPEQKESTQNKPVVKLWTSVRQTITANHHLDLKRSALEQARWPTLTPNVKPTQTENTHAEETRPTRHESDREHDSRDR